MQSAVEPPEVAVAPAAADRGAPRRARPERLLDRAVTRYGVAVALVAAAALSTFLIDLTTGSLSTFPFYAAVVGGAWFGLGPGCLSLVLSAVAVEDIWTPPLFSLRIDLAELPAFLLFVACAVMSLAWSSQRRRAQTALETTVRQRTAELLRTNAALQVEIAEREAAEQERTRTEQALRDAEVELARTLRLATLAELATAIAHEINQPLAAIAANGSACARFLAQRPPLLDNAREAAACIVADSHRAGDVIARIRALFNKEKPKEEVLNLNDLIRHVLDISRGAVERRRVTARIELAGAAPWVVGDPVQLQQVLVNLVTNALDSLAEVASRPRLLTIRSERAQGEAVVTVEDSGDGIAPGQISRIFDSFYTTKPDGIGVGLAISRSIIEAHGGSLWAARDTDCGARIGFRLPAARPPRLPAESGAASTKE